MWTLLMCTSGPFSRLLMSHAGNLVLGRRSMSQEGRDMVMICCYRDALLQALCEPWPAGIQCMGAQARLREVHRLDHRQWLAMLLDQCAFGG